MPTRVFISYAREDKESAERLYRDLKREGVVPWIDFADLIPGQLFERTIEDAIRDSDYFLALVSSRSVKKTGFVQKEIRHAIEVAKRHPEGKIYIIVLRLDECQPTFEDLRKLHWADLFSPFYEDTLADLLRAFKYSSEEKPALVVIKEEVRDGVITKLTDKGFGFIYYSHRMPNAFFHSNELVDVQFDELNEGDNITFFVAEGPKGRVAVHIARV